MTVNEYVQGLEGEAHVVSAKLAKLLFEGLPALSGQIWHGHPVWLDGKQPVAGFKAFPKYVTFMLWQGQDLEDASGRLSASGSARMATVKVASTTDLDDQLFAAWIQAAEELSTG